MLTDYPSQECKDDDIAFTKVALPYGWMQNMSAHPVIFKGHDFRTTEHLFQAMRFPFESEWFLELKEIKSPMAAKFYAKKHKEHMLVKERADQDIENMNDCLALKLMLHPDLVHALIETGERQLIEDVTKRPHGSGKFWGAAREGDSWVGYNVLGTMWMTHRDRLIKS